MRSASMQSSRRKIEIRKRMKEQEQEKKNNSCSSNNKVEEWINAKFAQKKESRERMKKNYSQEKESQKIQQIQQRNKDFAQKKRNEMIKAEREEILLTLIENLPLRAQETKLRIDDLNEAFNTMLREHGIEFNDDDDDGGDWKVNPELSMYDENDDFKDSRKVAAQATADRKAVLATESKTEATARTTVRAISAAAIAAIARAATKTKVPSSVSASASATATATATATTTATVTEPAAAVPRTKEEIVALQKATDYIHDYLFKGHY